MRNAKPHCTYLVPFQPGRICNNDSQSSDLVCFLFTSQTLQPKAYYLINLLYIEPLTQGLGINEPLDCSEGALTIPLDADVSPDLQLCKSTHSRI